MNEPKSYKWVQWKWADSLAGVDPLDRLFLNYVVRSADEDGWCYLSVEKYAKTYGVGRSTAFRSVKRLKAIGVLNTERRESPTSGRQWANWFHINTDVVLEGSPQCGLEDDESPQCGPPESTIWTDQSTMWTPSNVHLNVHLNVHKIASEKSDANIPKSETQEPGKILDNSDSENSNVLEFKVKTDDVLAKALNTLPMTMEEAVAQCGDSTKSSKLERLWKQLLTIYYPGKYQTALTNKQVGQLRHAAEKIQETGNFPAQTIGEAVAEWGKMVKFCKNQGVASELPERPNIGFLLFHVNTVVLWRESKDIVVVDDDMPKEFVPGQY